MIKAIATKDYIFAIRNIEFSAVQTLRYRVRGAEVCNLLGSISWTAEGWYLNGVRGVKEKDCKPSLLVPHELVIHLLHDGQDIPEDLSKTPRLKSSR